MARFNIKIAGHTAQVESLFESTRDYCARYLTEEIPEFTVTVCPADLAFEQQELDREALEEGLKKRKFTDPFLERTSIQRKVAQWLLKRNVLLLHGSAVAVDGRGYLFMAKCGTGKSTHTRYWRDTFGQRAVAVNDDKPFVEISARGAVLHGAPWSGKHGLDTNVSVPLQGICILTRGSENRIRSIPAEQAMDLLLSQGMVPVDGEDLPHYRCLTGQLAAAVPLWAMDCTKDPSAARVAYEAMR